MQTYTVWMTPGETNTVRFEGGNSRVYLDYITITPFNDLNEEAPAPVDKTKAIISKAWGRQGVNTTLEGLSVAVTSPTLENRQVTFRVSDETALEVLNVRYDAEKGITTADVRAKKEGIYVVFAETADGVTVSCSLDCYKLPNAVTMSKESHEGAIGESFELSATITSGDAPSGIEAYFSASDESAVVFDEQVYDAETGKTTVKVTLMKPGEHTLYASTEANEYAECALRITGDAQKLGDIDGNGTVNTTDARLALQYAVEKITLNEAQLVVGDVDGDGVVNTTDARLILQYAVEKIDKFPAEE